MAKKKKLSKNEKRIQNYKKLVEAGFDSKEATKYRDRSSENIKELVKEKKKEIRAEKRKELYHEARAKGFDSKESTKISSWGEAKREVFKKTDFADLTPEQKEEKIADIKSIGRMKMPDLIPVEDYKKKLLSPYSYVIGYFDERGHKGYITITSIEPMELPELRKKAEEILGADIKLKTGHYKVKNVIKIISLKSIWIESAIFNKEAFELSERVKMDGRKRKKSSKKKH